MSSLTTVGKEPHVSIYVPPIALSPSSGPGISASQSANGPVRRTTVKSPRWDKEVTIDPFNEKIPLELVQHIFSFLGPRHLNKARLICKAWCACADDEKFLRTMTDCYSGVVTRNGNAKPALIQISPAGNIADLLARARAPKTTVQAYQKAAKNYLEAKRAYVVEKPVRDAAFDRQRREKVERYHQDVELSQIPRREETPSCCCAPLCDKLTEMFKKIF